MESSLLNDIMFDLSEFTYIQNYSNCSQANAENSVIVVNIVAELRLKMLES